MGRKARASTPQIREDRSLVRRLLAGDRAAFDELCEAHFPGLFRFALSRLRNDEPLAREIAQAAFCKAIEKLPDYRGEAALFTWLCGFCRFEISAHFRRARREVVAADLGEKAGFENLLEAGIESPAGPEQELRRKEMTHLVHLTLDRLPPRYGQALEWKYVEGLPVAEIGERLGLSPKAAESVLSRAREAFRSGFAGLSKGLGGEGFRGLRLASTRRSA